MRKAMPTITESATELQHRMKSEKDFKKRQRLQALYLAVSGHARHRQPIATLVGAHRHSVAAWFDAYAQGGLEQALSYRVSTPPVHRRMTDAALTALQVKLNDPHGFAGDNQIRLWLAEQPHVTLSSSSVHALVRYKLHAKAKRPRPSHAKKTRKP